MKGTKAESPVKKKERGTKKKLWGTGTSELRTKQNSKNHANMVAWPAFLRKRPQLEGCKLGQEKKGTGTERPQPKVGKKDKMGQERT